MQQKIKYPDYNNSILGISSSILKYYGSLCEHKSLPILDGLLKKDYKNVVVMVFDGMGVDMLRENLSENSFLNRNIKSEISSVFPSTTTAAITSLESGLSPIRHGWLGWSLFFKEIGQNVNAYHNTLSESDNIPAADYHLANRHIPYIDIFDKIKRSTNERVKVYKIAQYSDNKGEDFDKIFKDVKELCKEDGQKFIYTYNFQPDNIMHETGCYSGETKFIARLINARLEKLCRELSDTLVIITADHGLIDVNIEVLENYPKITECLLRPPSIEIRARAFFVKEGMRERFKEEFEKVFKDRFMLFTKEEVLNAKLFGNGKPNERSTDFIGDFLAVSISDTCIIYNQNSLGGNFKAAHAGLTEKEMIVPLIIVKT